MTFGEGFSRRSNNFDAIRLVAAILVLFSHSYPLTGTGPDPIGWLSGGAGDGGSLAVGAFFVISGFLVTGSVLRRSADAYVRARFLRIVPALTVVVVAQTFLLGLAATTLPWQDYLRHPQTLGAWRSATVFDLRVTLPGVFEANPYPGAVNGSLWTLPVECGFYLALPLAAGLGLLRRSVVLGVAGAAFASLLLVAPWCGLSWAVHGPFVLGSMPLYPSLHCLVFFLVGAAMFVHRDRIPVSDGLAAACVVALYASGRTVSGDAVLHLALPYLVLWLALARPCTGWLRRVGDLSYGTYLYAFPVQQGLVAWHHGGLGALHLTLLALPIVLLCAALSWHLVERPALGRKPSGIMLPQENPLTLTG